MEYLLILLSAVMFSVQFFLNDCYQKSEGTTVVSALTFSLITSVFGCIMLIAYGGLGRITLFTFFMSAVSAIKNFIQIYCGIKVLKVANLSVYSLFSMLGGMLLPFIYGIACGERLTSAKAGCIIFIAAALFFGLPRGSQSSAKRKTCLYYAGIFILNGLSGILAEIHQSYTRLAADAKVYTLWDRIITVVLCVIWLIVLGQHKKLKYQKPLQSILVASGYAFFNTAANLILLYALLHVDASVQYPIVTGGVIVLSLAFDLILGRRPEKGSYIAALLSIAGMLLLVL